MGLASLEQLPARLTSRLGSGWTAATGVGAALLGATVVEARSRLASGRRVRDLVPDADLLRGAASRATTPLLPDDYLHMINPLWTARELRGKVVEVVPETADAATLVIRPGWGFSFDAQPGQYVGIGVQVDGRWHWRSYSLSAPPARDQGLISITVKAMPEGFLSTHLVNGLEPGAIVRLAQPSGEFVLPDPPPAKLLFWTGGSGITPVMAMLRTLNRRATMPDVVHVHAAPTRTASLFRDELQRMRDEHPSLTLIENFDDEHGILDTRRLAEKVPDWADRAAWVCGPTPMLDAAEQAWKRRGLADQLHIERFSAELSDSAEGGSVTFSKSERETEVDGATTLLEAGEAQGISMPFGCRMGICHTCVVPLQKGRVKDLRNGQEYEAAARVQTCVTAAAGDCVLEV